MKGWQELREYLLAIHVARHQSTPMPMSMVEAEYQRRASAWLGFESKWAWARPAASPTSWRGVEISRFFPEVLP